MAAADRTPTARITTDDLDFAAAWLRAYEGESGIPISAQDPADDDDLQDVLRRVAAWVEAEARRREDAAAERAIIRKVAANNGLPATDPRVRAAVRSARSARKGAKKETTP